ncbi:MAG: hypothetical protein RIR92_1747 [Pseudomonadota bacterium]
MLHRLGLLQRQYHFPLVGMQVEYANLVVNACGVDTHCLANSFSSCDNSIAPGIRVPSGSSVVGVPVIFIF